MPRTATPEGLAIGTLVRAARLESGISLRQAGVLTGLANPYISNIESGFVPQPSPFTLKKLALAYKVSYRKLFDTVGFPRP